MRRVSILGQNLPFAFAIYGMMPLLLQGILFFFMKVLRSLEVASGVSWTVGQVDLSLVKTFHVEKVHMIWRRLFYTNTERIPWGAPQCEQCGFVEALAWLVSISCLFELGHVGCVSCLHARPKPCVILDRG